MQIIYFLLLRKHLKVILIQSGRGTMTISFKFDVFLSYNKSDKPKVQALAERLRQDGLQVWLDDWQIKLGESIFSAIEHGLEHSRILLLFMSENALSSDWVTLESQTFRFQDPVNKERRVIPIRLDDAPAKGMLAQFKFADWRRQTDEVYRELYEACRSTQGKVQPEYLRERPNFPDFEKGWPHRRDFLELEFVDGTHNPIFIAQVDDNPIDCDDYILRVKTRWHGQLILIAQGTNQSFIQLAPNTTCEQKNVIAGEYFFPGKFMRLPCDELNGATRLRFSEPGIEYVLGFLVQEMPLCARLQKPLALLTDDEVREILSTLLDCNEAAMAFASITVSLPTRSILKTYGPIGLIP